MLSQPSCSECPSLITSVMANTTSKYHFWCKGPEPPSALQVLQQEEADRAQAAAMPEDGELMLDSATQQHLPPPFLAVSQQ